MDDFIKKILIGILIIWITCAAQYIDLESNQINFLHKHVIARIIVIFILCYFVIDFKKEYSMKKKLLGCSLITLGYFITSEI